MFSGSDDAQKVKPLVIDLGPTAASANDGLVFLDRLSSHVFYDFDGDSYRERTAWVGPDEGIVVWDKDKDGKVDAGEMILTKFVTGAKTDMDALVDAGFDKDEDGKIEASETDGVPDGPDADADAGILLIWQDKNINGVFDAGDVVSSFGSVVSEIDITGIDIDAQDKDKDGEVDSDEVLRFRDGSIVYGTYKVTLANGVGETTAYDMAFAHDDLGFKEVDGDTVLEGLTSSTTRRIKQVTAGATFELNDSGADYGAKGTAGNETISVSVVGTSGARSYSIDGEAGNDILAGGEGDDFIVGGAGADQIRSGRGNDILFVDGADTVINGGLGYDVVIVEGTVGRTLDLGAADVEAITGSDGGADTITAGTHLNVYMSGRGGNDTLTGGAGQDTVLGGTGNDAVRGNGGDDYLVGGVGADILYGHAGNDVIVMDKDDDIIGGKVDGGDGDDVLIYEGEDAKNLRLNLGNYGFESAVGSQGADEFRMRALDENGVSTVITANGVLIGRGGNDVLHAGYGDDVLSGDAGDDALQGNDGSDVYLYGRGGGSDTIVESGSGNGGRDTIAFGASIAVDDLVFSLTGQDLLLTVGGADGGKVTVVGWSDVANDKQVEILTFVDGTALDIANARLVTLGAENDTYTATAGSTGVPVIIQSLEGDDIITGDTGNDIVITGSGNDTVRGGAGHDYINGGFGADTLYGEAGDDTLIGGSIANTSGDKLYGGDGDDWIDGVKGNDTISGDKGEDVLIGGEGNDVVNGGDGDDRIFGGKGNDTLTGGLGDDVYFYGRGDGADLISDSGSDDDYHSVNYAPDSTGVDRAGDWLVFGAGITIDDLVFDALDGDIIIGVGIDGDLSQAPIAHENRIVLNDVGNTGPIERFVFSDGYTIDFIEEMGGADTGNNANNSFSEGDGNYFISLGAGNDEFTSGKGSDILLGGAGDDLLNGAENDDIVFGGLGNDRIYGGKDKNRMYGGDGNDRLYGAAPEDYPEQIYQGHGEWIPNPELRGADDFLYGGAGNDTMYGYLGNDTYVFGWNDGADRISETGGVDVVQLTAGIWLSDLLVGVSSSGGDIELTLNETPFGQVSTDKLSLTKNQFSGTSGPLYHGIELLRFANGYTVDFSAILKGQIGTVAANSIDYSSLKTEAAWVTGLDGNDTLKTGEMNDVLIGGRHDDALSGGLGNDLYVFNAGDGRDLVTDTGGDKNSLVMGYGITHNDVFLVTQNENLFVVFRDAQTTDGVLAEYANYIEITGWYGEGGRRSIQWMEFADGTSIKLSDIGGGAFLGTGDDTYTGSGAGQWIDGGSGNDTINAGAGHDRIYGKLGDDIIDAGEHNDWVDGGEGIDTIKGGIGDDILGGGDGNDVLTDEAGNDTMFGGKDNDSINGGSGANLLAGGEGNDTIFRGGQGDVDGKTLGTEVLFAAGDGDDVIKLSAGQDGSRDIVSIVGYSTDELWFKKTTTNDLLVSFLGSEDSMLFEKFFDGGLFDFEKIKIGSRYLNDEKIASLTTAMASYDPNDGTDGVGITSSTLPTAVKTALDGAWLYSA